MCTACMCVRKQAQHPATGDTSEGTNVRTESLDVRVHRLHKAMPGAFHAQLHGACECAWVGMKWKSQNGMVIDDSRHWQTTLAPLDMA